MSTNVQARTDSLRVTVAIVSVLCIAAGVLLGNHEICSGKNNLFINLFKTRHFFFSFVTFLNSLSENWGN